MRDAGGHLAERAQLLRTHQLVLRGGQLAEGPGPFLVEARGAEREGREIRDVAEQPLVGVGIRAHVGAQGERAEHVVARLHGHPIQCVNSSPYSTGATPRRAHSAA